MNIHLYKKYGNYYNGYFIVSHSKFHNFLENECGGSHKKAKRKLRLCWLWMLIPMLGIILMELSIENKGLQSL